MRRSSTAGLRVVLVTGVADRPVDGASGGIVPGVIEKRVR
jgi:hypothetical protein